MIQASHKVIPRNWVKLEFTTFASALTRTILIAFEKILPLNYSSSLWSAVEKNNLKHRERTSVKRPQKIILYLPNNRSFSSFLASLLSFRSCLSISALIRFCSFCSSLRQHAIFTFVTNPLLRQRLDYRAQVRTVAHFQLLNLNNRLHGFQCLYDDKVSHLFLPLHCGVSLLGG